MARDGSVPPVCRSRLAHHPIDRERWGTLEGQRQLRGRPLGVPDAQIAATALEHDLTLVTRNVRDFEHLGVPIFNPWDPAWAVRE